MKKNLLYIAILACFVLCVGCDDSDVSTPTLNVSVDTENAIRTEDGIPVFKTGTSVKFLLNEKSDMITFYSGENGSEYRYKDRTELEGTPSMYFKTTVLYGTKFNTLFVYLSSDFKGFSANKDKEKDAASILDATWTDITDMCNLPTTKNAPNNVTETPLIDLSEYKNKDLYIAFRFYREANGEPTFNINNFRIYNEFAGVQNIIVRTGTAGWGAFDFNATGTQDPYATNGGISGVNRSWNLSKAVTDEQLTVGGSNTTENDDWLISAPIKVSAVSPDLGIGLKGFGDVSLKTHSYIYENPGEYTVSFIGINSFMKDKATILKEVKIKIEE